MRKNVLKYDDVMNRQREAIYSDRRHILDGDDLAGRVQGFLEGALRSLVSDHAVGNDSDEWNLEALWTEAKLLYPVGITIDEVVAEAHPRLTADFLYEQLLSDAKIAYQKREESLGSPAMRLLERRVVLSVIDRKWRDHLYEMDYLREGIGLRTMAQRDPVVEYQNEGFALYQQMMSAIREESVQFLFNLEVKVQQGASPEAPAIEGGGLEEVEEDTTSLTYSAPDEDGEASVHDAAGHELGAETGKARAKSGNPAVAAQARAASGNREQRRAATKQAKAAPKVGAFGQVEDDEAR
jgi:preprotein translocase subunit SecA